MTTARIHRLLAVAVAALAITAVLRLAAAGPPAICHPLDIGDARSLPWGDDPFRPGRIDTDRIVPLTIEILDGSDSPIVHMETLRRATILADRRKAVAPRLLAAVVARALDSAASDAPNALAWFDAGYLVQAYHQMGLALPAPCGRHDGVDGYGWIRKAIELRPADAELEFAAANATVLAGTPAHSEHAARARRFAPAESLALRNLDRQERLSWPHFRPAD